MVYSRYSDEVERLEGAEWVLIDSFTSWLNELETVNMAVQEGRNKGLEIFNNRQTVSWFFDDNKRFPDKSNGHRFVAICLDINDWASTLEQLYSALSYKTPDVSKTDKDLGAQSINYAVSYKGSGKDKDVNLDDETSKKITSQDERKLLQQAIKSYATALQKARSQKTKSAYTMGRFEHTFGIEWTT